MKVVFFVHAVASCWNNGNAHFLRGLGTALQGLGHEVIFWEPKGSWSEMNLVSDYGHAPLTSFHTIFPKLRVEKYDPANPDLDACLHGADLVIVHEWNEPPLVKAIGQKHIRGSGFALLFHDTHHRSATAPSEMQRFDLSGYDGVLAFGEVVAERYRQHGWSGRSWAFHEAADSTVFFPREGEQERELIWIGNWGDEERSDELREFLIAPARQLHLRASIYGVRYPAAALEELAEGGISYRGWLPNHKAPDVFARSLFTVHIPRRPYAEALPGIPTIRVFEALACGIPLVCAPWRDAENLFPSGCFLMALDGAQMQAHMRALRNEPDLREHLRQNGLRAIASRHTCEHRAQQLLEIYGEIVATPAREAA